MLNMPGAGASGGAGVAVNVADGQATAAKVGTLVEEMKDVIKQIAQHAGNASPTWKGSAGVAFDGTHTDWNKTALTMNQLLEQIKTQLSSGFAGYEDQDAAAAGGLNISV
ncbi:WXG100 family type VII secretion target [Gordonia sp. zg691]|uniref:ESAT-6-like protein n=1 Tax=Gordonia jinghuaiqii TaxID=2758710 RepID=A0A7D7QYW6_9ACTN|nr:WXG100 family type VII secretion target [Gordonia jinghuaiqii]MBD0860862.1 WXG100 family type VII secretion target [Gordonia jinghuaiqii]MCR5979577.1 WXG100 family type VII secretion target [Gordonia jinghuaiqii]QMT00631.1 WXG100 family type VII secretion target [Gordonia jinghuaiqii]